MEQRNELKDLLYEKMSEEQDNFIENLKHSSPEEIIQSAYEKVMRDDILMNGLKMTVHIWICSEIRLTIFQKTL